MIVVMKWQIRKWLLVIKLLRRLLRILLLTKLLILDYCSVFRAPCARWIFPRGGQVIMTIWVPASPHFLFSFRTFRFFPFPSHVPLPPPPSVPFYLIFIPYPLRGLGYVEPTGGSGQVHFQFEIFLPVTVKTKLYCRTVNVLQIDLISLLMYKNILQHFQVAGNVSPVAHACGCLYAL